MLRVMHVRAKDGREMYTVLRSACRYDCLLPARRYASAGTIYGPVYVSVCVYVCLSVISRCSIERDERFNLLFGMAASFDQCCAVY